MREYIIESDFVHNGLRCVVLFLSMGHRCGYVGFDKTNPFYEKGYSDKFKLLKSDDIKDQELGKRSVMTLFTFAVDEEYTSPDCYFDVHGGITYADGGENSRYPVESNLWWFGFDCAHYNDGKDYVTAKEYFKDNESLLNRIIQSEEIDSVYLTGGVARSKNYVEQECKNLADQIVKLVTGGKCE